MYASRERLRVTTQSVSALSCRVFTESTGVERRTELALTASHSSRQSQNGPNWPLEPQKRLDHVWVWSLTPFSYCYSVQMEEIHTIEVQQCPASTQQSEKGFSLRGRFPQAFWWFSLYRVHRWNCV